MRRSGASGADGDDGLVFSYEARRLLFFLIIPRGFCCLVLVSPVEGEMKSEVVHRRWSEVKMRRWTRLGNLFGRFITETHRSASQRGTRGEMMRHYVFLAKAVIGSERLSL